MILEIYQNRINYQKVLFIYYCRLRNWRRLRVDWKYWRNSRSMRGRKRGRVMVIIMGNINIILHQEIVKTSKTVKIKIKQDMDTMKIKINTKFHISI